MKPWNRFIRWVAIYCACLFFSNSAEAENKAILVGINKYPNPQHELFAAHNDVNLVKSYLIQDLGFSENNIVVLKDREATSRGLTRAIKDHFIKSTTEEDGVLFYYAGHGTGVKDFDGDEKDGLDETLMTYDFSPTNPSTWFTDDLLYELLRRIPSRKVITIFDCCHSGSGNRGAKSNLPLSSKFRSRFANSGFYTFNLPKPDQSFLNSRSVLSTKPDPNHVFLAACRDEEESWEGVYEGELHGVFTHSLIQNLREKQASTLGEVAEAVRSEIVSFTTQTAELKKQSPTSTMGKRGNKFGLREYFEKPIDPRDSEELDTSLKLEGVPRYHPPTLEEVTPGYFPRGDIGVVLKTRNAISRDETNQFAPGELLEIELLSDSTGFAEIYYYGVDDQVYRLFPNGKHADNRIVAGQKLIVPGRMPFRLRMALPEDFPVSFANEVLFAVVTTEPFSEETSETNKERLFKVVDGKKLNPARDRLIEIEDGPRFGEAMKIYRIKK